MPNFQEKGIYSGGVVTKGVSPDNYIYISPYLLHLYSGGVTGSGAASAGVTKKIKVNFSGTVGGNAFRESVKAPAYNLFTGPSSGAVYIFYDETAQDLGFTVIPPVNKIVFARIFWTTVASSMSDIQIDTSYNLTNPNRTEAYVAETQHPEEPDKFYFDGQKFIGGALNKPLANLAVMSEVLQNDSLSTFGNSYFITMAQDSDVYGSGGSIKLKETFHIERRADCVYRSYHTKEDPVYGVGAKIAFVKNFLVGDLIGDNVYVVINKTTGAPDIVRVSDLGTLGITIGVTHYLISKSTGPHDLSGTLSPSLSNLSQIIFQAENNKAGSASLKKTQAAMLRNTVSSGFFKAFDVLPSNTTDSIYVPSVAGNVDGYFFEMPSTTINLGPAPLLGSAQDFAYLQVTVTEDPDITIQLNIMTTQDVDYLNYPDPFDNPSVKSFLQTDISPETRTGPQFVYNTAGGYYEAPNPLPGSNTRYLALPLAYVPRFNQGGANPGNPNGGLSRIDGKTYNFLSIDEVLTLAPIVTNRGNKALLLESLRLVLESKLNNRLEQSAYAPGVWSKRPFHVDYLDAYSEGVHIGDTDGGRRLWGGNSDKEEVISFTFKHNQAFSYPYGDFSYTIATTLSVLQLRVPTSVDNDTLIVTDPNGQPLSVKIQWASDGAPVDIVGSWAPSFNSEGFAILETIELDTSTVNYTSHTSGGPANICVSFKVRHRTKSGFTKIPLTFFKASRGGQDGKDDNFAIVPDVANNPKLLQVLDSPTSRSVTVNSIVRRDSLYLTRSGPVEKGYAMQLHYVVAGSGLALTPYSIPDTYTILNSSFPKIAGTYRLLSLLDIKRANGQSVKAQLVEWLPSGSFKITISAAIPTTEPLTFIFGLDGLQLDYTPGALEISNVTEANVEMFTKTANSSGFLSYFYNNNIIQTHNGSTIFGFTSGYNKLRIFAESVLTSSYVSVPVKVTGFGTGLIKIDTTISSTEFSQLSSQEQSVYENHVPGRMRIKAGTPLMFSVLHALNESGAIVFMYQYGASSFYSFDPEKEYEIVDEGWLILSNDGVANGSGSAYSPVSERFPVVQDVEVVGLGIAPNPVGLNPVSFYNQSGELICPGSPLVLDSRYSLGLFVLSGSGIAVWAGLVRQGVKLLLAIYQVRDGQFIMSNPEQAFLSELKYNYRELM